MQISPTPRKYNNKKQENREPPETHLTRPQWGVDSRPPQSKSVGTHHPVEAATPACWRPPHLLRPHGPGDLHRRDAERHPLGQRQDRLPPPTGVHHSGRCCRSPAPGGNAFLCLWKFFCQSLEPNSVSARPSSDTVAPFSNHNVLRVLPVTRGGGLDPHPAQNSGRPENKGLADFWEGASTLRERIHGWAGVFQKICIVGLGWGYMHHRHMCLYVYIIYC